MNSNIVLVVAFIIIIVSMLHGLQKGMVEEIVSLISLLVAVVVVFLFGIAVIGFIDRQMNSMIVAIIFILVMGLVFKLLSVLFMSLKILAKLPVIKLFDKLAGVGVGFFEGIIFIWIIFLIFNFFDCGVIGDFVINGVKGNVVLNLLYTNNWLEQVLSILIINNSYLAHLVTRL